MGLYLILFNLPVGLKDMGTELAWQALLAAIGMKWCFQTKEQCITSSILYL